MFCFALFSASFTAHASTEDVARTHDNFRTVIFVRNSDGTIGTTISSKTVKAGTWGEPYQVDITNYRWSNYSIEYEFYYDKDNSLIAPKGSSILFDLSNFVMSSSYVYNGQTYQMGNFHPENSSNYIAYFKDRNGNIIKRVDVSNSNISSYGVGMMS